MAEGERIVAYYAVDRLEGRLAVLVGDDGSQHEVSRKRLPKGAAESSVLEVPLDGRGQPKWDAAKLNAAERDRRLSRARALLEELKKGDPGGDVVL